MSQQYWGHQQRQKLAFNNQAVLPRSGRVFSNPGFDQIQCGIQESAKYLDRTQDLTAPQEVEFAKIRVQDAGFFAYLLGIWYSAMNQINVLVVKVNQTGEHLV